MRLFISTVVCFSLFAASAQATIRLESTPNPDPAPGLSSFTISAVGDAGEIINSFAGINIPGGVHNIVPPFGQPATIMNQWATDGANGASLAEWEKFDTFFLFNPCEIVCVPVGFFVETNDGSDPAGLNLMNFGQQVIEGLGAFRHSLPTDQVTITPSMASSHVAFLQVIVPTGESAFLDVAVFDNTGARADFTGFEIGVPEPGTMVLAALSLIGWMASRRRNG